MGAVLNLHHEVRVVVVSHLSGVHELGPHLISVDGSKQLGEPRSSAQLRFKFPWGREPYVADDDWIFLYQKGFGGGVKVRVLFVDSVTLTQAWEPTTGTETAEVTVQASDVGKPFAVHEFRTHPGHPPGVPGLLPALLEEVYALSVGPSTMEAPEFVRRCFRAVMRPGRVRKRESAKDEPGSAPPVQPPAPPPLASGNLTAHFKLQEFASPDKAPFPPDVVQRLTTLAGHLETLRGDYFGGKAVTIVSGYRSPTANQKNGVAQSYHLVGMAADIRVAGMTPREVGDAIKAAINAGEVPPGGLGLYATFVHYDIGDGVLGGDRPAIWVGQSQGYAPPADQAAGWMPWQPTPAAPEVEESAGEGQERSLEPPPPPPKNDYEVVAGVSGDGIYVTPIALSERISGASRFGGANVPKYDWVDVCDMETWMERPSKIHGRRWQMHPLYSMGKATTDPFVRALSDPTFNELFYDTRRVADSPSVLADYLGGWAPVVVYRRRPLDLEDWRKLDTLTLDAAWLSGQAWTRGGAERFHYFYARLAETPEIAGPLFDEVVAGGAGQIPAIDTRGEVNRHGLRSMDAEAQFVYWNDEDLTWHDSVREATETLYRWNRPLPDLYAATLAFPFLHPDALVGNKLRLVGSRYGTLEGYIEGVHERVQVDPMTGGVDASTNLTVTRLHPDGQYPAPNPIPWKEG